MEDTRAFLEIFRDILALRKVYDYGLSVSRHPLEPYVNAANDMFRLVYGHNFKGMDHNDIHRVLYESIEAELKEEQTQRQAELSRLIDSVLLEPKRGRRWFSWLWS